MSTLFVCVWCIPLGIVCSRGGSQRLRRFGRRRCGGSGEEDVDQEGPQRDRVFPGAGGRHEWQDDRVLLRRYSGLAVWGLRRGWGFPLLEIFDVASGF